MPKKSARRRKKSSLIKNLKWLSRDRLPTIISILVLLVGLAAGVSLVQRQQELREKAQVPEPCFVCEGVGICKKIANPPYCNPGDSECFVPEDCIAPIPTPTSAACPEDGQCQGNNKCYRWKEWQATCILEYDETCCPQPTTPPSCVADGQCIGSLTHSRTPWP